MEELLNIPQFVDVAWLVTTFLLGFIAKQVNLLPMIGFLASGFILNFLGLTEGSLALKEISDLGILLLLFTIGLKLDLKLLAKPFIWAGTTIHVALSVLFFSALILLLSTVSITAATDLTLQQAILIGFALSFSSTVFAVKVLEANGEMASSHGRAAIGILIMQDILAVLFITFSKGSYPSLWALAIPVVLFVARPLLMKMMDHVGYGELLSLAGLFTAVALGATLFSIVGLKPDLGALTFGVLIADHPRAAALSKSLYGFKDLFLVGFFLSIGLDNTPSWIHVLIAFGLVVILPVKSGLYLLVLSRFKLRIRTVFLTMTTLSNYSIFGLLVVSISVGQGWLSPEWLVIVSLSLSLSFVFSAPLNSSAVKIYDRYAPVLKKLETVERLAEDLPIKLSPKVKILIFGMSEIGVAAYDETRKRHGGLVVGFDVDPNNVDKQQQAGRNVMVADATDIDLWQRLNLENVNLVMLAMQDHKANMSALAELRKGGYDGFVTATAWFEDQLQELLDAGASAAYNVHFEAGTGYADHVCRHLCQEPGCMVS